MQTPIQNYSHIVVTGGSSGIGKALIECVLSLNDTLHIANLSRSNSYLSAGRGLCQHFPVDLSDAGRVLQVFYELESWIDRTATGPAPRILLVNNSGFGTYGPFAVENLENQLNMIDLNVKAAVQLTGLLMPRLRAGKGGVVNVASTAAFQPLAHMATYAATKAFLLSWGMALHEEIKKDGCFCMTHCPGPTSTAFFKRAGFTETPVTGGMGQSAKAVARSIISGVEGRRSLRVSGFHNWFLAGIGGTLPRRWVAPLGAALVQAMRLDRKQGERQA